MESANLTRRGFIRSLGLAGATVLVAACGAPAAPTSAPAASAPKSTAAAEAPKPAVEPAKPAAAQGEKTITLMFVRGQLSEVQQKQYEELNPGIKINFIVTDLVALMAQTAAGTPPDCIRTSAADLPGFIARKMLKDLTPFYKSSTVLKIEDLVPANKNYWYEGFQVGKGKIYGNVMDWSPDMSLFINKKHFDAASVPVPSDDEPITYEKMFELAGKLTKKSGDRTEVMGYCNMDDFFATQWDAHANEAGTSIWSDDFKKAQFQTAEAKKIFDYYFQLSKANAMYNPLNPSSVAVVDAFKNGQLAIVQAGYWFSASAETDATRGNVVMLPAPKWGAAHKSPCLGAVGTVVHEKTKVLDEVWKFREWLHGGEPAQVRAKSGWGVPGLQSLQSLMPNSTPYQKQIQKVLQYEIKISDPSVRFQPYTKQGMVHPLLVSWKKNLEAGLRGQATIDQIIGNVDKDVAAAITDGVSQIG